jgi:hypothetical protein
MKWWQWMSASSVLVLAACDKEESGGAEAEQAAPVADPATNTAPATAKTVNDIPGCAAYVSDATECHGADSGFVKGIVKGFQGQIDRGIGANIIEAGCKAAHKTFKCRKTAGGASAEADEAAPAADDSKAAGDDPTAHTPEEGVIAALSLDKKRVIVREECPKKGRVFNYVSCGQTAREKVKTKLCEENGKGLQKYLYQLGEKEARESSVYCK